jgi:hypothetical protein
MIHKNILLTLPRTGKKQKYLTDRTFVRQLVIRIKKIYPEIKYRDITNIIDKFNQEIINEAVRNRDGVELPERLGLIFIAACDIDVRKIPSLHLGPNIDIWETNGKLCKIFYINNLTKYPLPDKRIWKLDFTTTASNIASTAFKDNFYRYINIPNDVRPEQFLTEEIKKSYDRKDYLADYDSLEI